MSIKKLAGQTFWYGFSNILGRFLNYLLTPLLTGIYSSEKYGDISILFAMAAFLNVVFTYGMETSYFRFNNSHPERDVYNTGMTSMIGTTIVFTAALLLAVPALADFMRVEQHPEYVRWVIWIVALDTIAVLPFSKLRHEGRPRKFAMIKILNILINTGMVVFFLVLCKGHYEKGRNDAWAAIYNPSIDIGYVFLAQLIASAATLLLLGKEMVSFRFHFNRKLMAEILMYSAPLIIVGFGGMINETIDRFMIIQRYHGTIEDAKSANGVYSANNKLALLIVIFINTFRMGAEPFFFKQAKEENAPKVYARVMKFFVITCCFCFLGVSLFLDVWKHFMGIRKHPEYLAGLSIVPVLMLSRIFLGVYYNMSIWYKLTNRNLTGAWITIGGAVITIIVNYTLIPYLGFVACAISVTLCYGYMMVASYILGQKYYPVPYAVKKLTAYVVICLLLYGMHELFRHFSPSVWWTHAFGLVEMLAFMALIVKVEKREMIRIPVLGKLLYPGT